MKIPYHKVLLFIHDTIVIICGIFISNFIYYNHFLINSKSTFGHLGGLLILFCTVIIFFTLNHLYKYQVVLNRTRHVLALLKSLLSGLVILVFISFIFKITEITMNRILLGTIFTVLFFLFIFSRVVITPLIYYWLIESKRFTRKLIIIGAGRLSAKIVHKLLNSRKSYFYICGLLDDDTSKKGDNIEDIPVLAPIKDINNIIIDQKISDILICINNIQYDRLQSIIDLCKKTPCTIHIISDLYNIVIEKLEIEEIAGISAFRLYRYSPKNGYHVVKRLLDLFVASIIIILLLPIWIITILCIKLDSRGPIFYKAPVVGIKGKEFFMCKFRSMYDQCNKDVHIQKAQDTILSNNETQKLRNDPRITKVGRFLRKYSIDEFPQLLNVIRGEMSLVGPRPNVPYEYEVMDEWQKRRQSVLPGMTGIWQIKGRDDVKYNDQVVLDLYYIENRSLKLDLEILLKTIPVVIFGKGGL